MAAIHTTAAKSAMATAIKDLIESGSPTPGKLKIRNSSNTVLVTITLTDPCGSVSNGVLTLDTTPALEGTVTAAGTADDFIITDSADTEIFEGSVGTSGADLNLSSLTLAVDDTVSIDPFTWTAPA